MTNDLKLISNIGYLYNTEIILYGASYTGERMYKILKKLNIPVSAFCDGNPNKKECCGLSVISPEQMKEKYISKKVTIIISSVYVAEISEIIEKLELDAFVVTYIGVEIAIDCNLDNANVPKEYRIQYETKKKLEIEILEKSYQQDTRKLDIDNLFEINDNDSILVYQPGKVGSSSIHNSLGLKGIPSVHLHRLNYNKYLHGKNNEESYNLLINSIKNKEKIKIVTGVREPISHDISGFMHNLNDGRWFTYDFLDKDINKIFKKVIDNYYVNKKEKRLEDDFKWLDICWNHGKYGQVFEWFDYEIKNVFGIDIYEYPFDKEKGYCIIKKGNVEIFLYKLEKLKFLEDELGKFVGYDDFKLVNANMAYDKRYFCLYKEFMNNLKLDRQYFDFYYKNNERVKFFYDNEEINRFKEKWEKYL